MVTVGRIRSFVDHAARALQARPARPDQTAAAEYAAQGIRINVVCPGAYLTPMLQAVFDRLAPGAPDKAATMYRARIPMNRIGDPAECARAIAWLLSDAASYVTGTVLTVCCPMPRRT